MSMSIYNVARYGDAVQNVDRGVKPLATVPVVIGIESLGGVVDEAISAARLSDSGEVKVHVAYRRGVAECAFYKYEWCRRALEFVDSGDCDPSAIDWIHGLLFGYHAEAIQRFISKSGHDI